MSHYEERLEKDLVNIRSEVSKLAGWVDEAVNNSIHALLSGNEELANTTILHDGPINRKMREIDSMCHRFVAVHLPSAGPLRLISSVIRINIILERIGDYAVTISRELQQLSEVNAALDENAARGIELLANEVQLMLKQAITSFEESNMELAKSTIAMASQIDNTVGGLYQGLYDENLNWPLKEGLPYFRCITGWKELPTRQKTCANRPCSLFRARPRRARYITFYFLMMTTAASARWPKRLPANISLKAAYIRV